MYEVASKGVEIRSGGITTDAAAAYLAERHDCHHTAGTLKNLRCLGGGPLIYRDGRSVRYLPADLDQYAKSRICGPFGLGSEAVFHGLRKSAVVTLLEAGCSDAEVAAITAQSRQMIEHYARQVNQKRLAAAGSSSGNALGTAVCKTACKTLYNACGANELAA